MAPSCQRLVNRTMLSSIKSAIRSNITSPHNHKPPTSSSRFSAFTTSNPAPLRRFSLSRSPSELGCVQSLLPLHSAVSAVRMTSCLSTSSRSCRALSQAFRFVSARGGYIHVWRDCILFFTNTFILFLSSQRHCLVLNMCIHLIVMVQSFNLVIENHIISPKLGLSVPR